MKMKSTPSIPTHAKTLMATGMLLLLPGLVSAQSTFNFSLPAYTCSESDRSTVLQVVRSGAADTLASVDYATKDGTARNGLKYTATAGTLQFTAGHTNLPVIVPILNDGFVQGNQFFQVVLSNPSQGTTLGTRTNATVSISDNDLGVQFTSPTNSVSESAGVAQVAIIRTEDGGNAVTVDILSTDLTAREGVDYVGISNRVTFGPEEIMRIIPIQILNHNFEQAARSFKLTLSNATGTSLGPQVNTTVSILDDDHGFRFAATDSTVSEDAGAVPIVVLRGIDDANSTVTVDLYTLDQTAVSGSDYVGMTNTLSFAPGEARKLIPVRILNDGIKEPTKSLRVCLANPSPGKLLSSPSMLTVTIVDNDPRLGFEQISYATPWGASEIALTVLRGNDAALGPVTVDYATTDLSARAGTDYQAVSGTLQFETNQTLKTLRVPILVNRPVGAVKSFRVTLSNLGGGAVLGTATATVSLQGAFLSVGPSFSPQLGMRRDGGFNLVTWLGEGQLQRADQPTGPWSSLAGVQSPLPVSCALPGSFYRIKNPRPVSVYVPAQYDGHTPTPLVIALHGYTGNGSAMDSYFNLTSFAASRGFLYCYPDGLMKAGGLGWNAWFDDPVIASFYSSPWSDDVGFIRGIVEAVANQFALDRKRVYLIGHSMGGGMAHFAAVRNADLIAGIASLAGNPAVFYPAPTEPVNILIIHGTADETVSYKDALPTAPPYSPLFPGALHLGQIWADFNGAKDRVTEATRSLDLEASLAGLDTVITRWTNAPPGGAVEVWSILGGTHIPSLSPNFTPKVLDWLLAHPKP